MALDEELASGETPDIFKSSATADFSPYWLLRRSQLNQRTHFSNLPGKFASWTFPDTISSEIWWGWISTEKVDCTLFRVPKTLNENICKCKQTTCRTRTPGMTVARISATAILPRESATYNPGVMNVEQAGPIHCTLLLPTSVLIKYKECKWNGITAVNSTLMHNKHVKPDPLHYIFNTCEKNSQA